MATANPMAQTYPTPPPSVSKETHTIAGILTTVYGLQELHSDIHNVACLWLLHPRLQTQSCMEPIASSTINVWNSNLQKCKDRKGAIGLIAVSFDQRNHGSREVDPLANEAWRSGNKKHAQDMFSIYRNGTALDTSHLITYLPSYIFPTTTHILTQHLVLGVSLGGHAAWHCLLHEPLITTAIVIIGCPDYIHLMTDRARLSRLESWKKSNPPGSAFLGSADFPTGLIEAVERYDPAGLLLGEVAARGSSDNTYGRQLTEKERTRVIPLMKKCLQGKRILNLAGRVDRLVPYRCSEPFLRWLESATGPGGFFADGGVTLRDVVYEGVGHEMSPGMVEEVHRFVVETLEHDQIELMGKDSKI